MVKVKTQFVCNACGSDSPKWSGQCAECAEWNTMVEFRPQALKGAANKVIGYAGVDAAKVQSLSEVALAQVRRISTVMDEFDRVLGGGIVPGSVILIGGDPGIGKSSILLQVMSHLSRDSKVLYVTGEESAEQVALRAHRMELPSERLRILTETAVERIVEAASQEKPSVMVIDSIQTMQLSDLSSAPGGVSQVRESAAFLTRFAKQFNTAIFLVGHVTKSGEVAGPRVLEHIVDAVIFIEGQSDSRFRTLRALKNRFGAVNELGVFAMTDKGMREVKNPSAIFLSRGSEPTSGSIVTVTWEGSRPLLVEVQALVDDNQFGQPRRVTVGLDHSRLSMLLAILHRHGGVELARQDVFANVVGGVKLAETSADLALTLAIVSSLKDKPLPQDLIIFGEVGLSGEIRPVNSGLERLQEASKHGFKRAIVPFANLPRQPINNIEIVGVKKLSEALDIAF